MRTRKNSKINMNEEQNMQRKKRRLEDLQNYSASCTYLDLNKWQIFGFLRKKFASQIHMTMVFEDDSVLIMTKDRMVHGLGSNKNGRLGLDKDGEDYIQPEKVEQLSGKNIKTFYCSTDAKCIFALTEEGELYSWGINKKCRLGREMDSPTERCMPAKINGLSEEQIIDIASNEYNSLALTDNGKVYIWGDVEFSYERFESQPCQVKFELENKKIVNIACGSTFIMALTDNGKLYSWGIFDYSDLELSEESIQICSSPCLISSLTDVIIVKIVCGFNHSLALTSEGRIYSWGNNNEGQLGHGKKTLLEKKPIMLDKSSMGEVSDIAAQHNKSVAVNKIGCVYIWGLHAGQTIWKPVRTEYLNMYDIFKYEVTYIIDDSTKEKSNMLKYLGPAFNDESTSDFTIKVEGQLIYVHKAILKIRCQHFRSMFQNNWAENNQSIIEHNQFSYNVYKAFLKYLYTNVIDDLSLEEVLELLKLCDEYNETDLERKCIKIIRENITVSNVALCYAKAIKCNAKDLEELCLQFALSKTTAVIQSETFATLNKDLQLDFMFKAAEAGAYKT